MYAWSTFHWFVTSYLLSKSVSLKYIYIYINNICIYIFFLYKSEHIILTYNLLKKKNLNI